MSKVRPGAQPNPKQREFENGSAYPNRPPEFEATPGTDGAAGIILAFLDLGENAYMKVYERVKIRDGQPHRTLYAYALIIDGVFVHGWERDPDTHPECPVHEHGPAPRRERSEGAPVTLPQALERAWEEISLSEEAPP